MRHVTIGRSRQNDIIIEEPLVSRRHAELRELGGGRYKMVDLGSTHGTHIDRDGIWNRVTVAEVTPGNRVRFGSHTRSIASLIDAAPVAKPVRRTRQTMSTTVARQVPPRAGSMAIAACLFVGIGAAAAAAYYFLPG